MCFKSRPTKLSGYIPMVRCQVVKCETYISDMISNKLSVNKYKCYEINAN